jgi:hypothetical protein
MRQIHQRNVSDKFKANSDSEDKGEVCKPIKIKGNSK